MQAHAEVLAPLNADFRSGLTDCSGTYWCTDALTATTEVLTCVSSADGRYTAANLVYGVAITGGVVCLLHDGYPFT